MASTRSVKQHLVGGISSLGRALPPLDGEDLMISHSAGAHLWDAHGRRFIDTAMGFGATLVGHAHPHVVEAVTKALEQGPMPAFAHAREEEAAAALARNTGALDEVVFVNSGTEAVHLACRIARHITGRRRIAKFAAAYDGWHDDVAFGNAGSAAAAMSGNRRSEQGDVVLLRYNDENDLDQLFADQFDIAAILAEPVLANAGMVMPKPGYLARLQETARRHGTLIIADEVLMGFRIANGLAAHQLGLDPDLATVGKVIGSGIAVAAVLGKSAILGDVRNGKIIRAGTYSGNPVSCAAVIATSELLAELDYTALLARGDRLRACIARLGAEANCPLATAGYGSVFSIWFAPSAPTTYEEALAVSRPERSLQLHLALRRNGVVVMPSCFGRLFLSEAHDEASLGEIGDAMGRSLVGFPRS